MLFQSTLPRRERRGLAGVRYPQSVFQSTLPRRERLKVIFVFFTIIKISIHAPTKGATFGGGANGGVGSISIHAPTKGATDETGELDYEKVISIHAPTKGAT